MTKPILFLTQIDIEGPGRLAEFLDRKNVPWTSTALYDGGELPKDPTAYRAIVPLGGPMNVYEEAHYPFLAGENQLIQRAIEKEAPVLGICLGAQLLAKAANARVAANAVPEIGWMNVELTEAGLCDPLFQGFDRTIPVFQWHGDTFDLPENATHLATSEDCAYQAFRLGRNAYGLQFHVEVTPDMVQTWTGAYLNDLRRHDDGTIERRLAQDGPRHDAALAEATERLLDNFLAITSSHG